MLRVRTMRSKKYLGQKISDVRFGGVEIYVDDKELPSLGTMISGVKVGPTLGSP